MPDEPKVEAVKENKENIKQEPVKDAAVSVKNESLKIAQQQQVDKLMDIIINNPNIIRRNDQTSWKSMAKPCRALISTSCTPPYWILKDRNIWWVWRSY